MHDYRSYLDDHYAREVRESEQRWDADEYRFLREKRSGGLDLAAIFRQIVVRLECRFVRQRYRLTVRAQGGPVTEPCS